MNMMGEKKKKKNKSWEAREKQSEGFSFKYFTFGNSEARLSFCIVRTD